MPRQRCHLIHSRRIDGVGRSLLTDRERAVDERNRVMGRALARRGYRIGAGRRRNDCGGGEYQRAAENRRRLSELEPDVDGHHHQEEGDEERDPPAPIAEDGLTQVGPGADDYAEGHHDAERG